MNYYEIYERVTGELLAHGTARECRRELGCASLDSFYALVGRSLRGVNRKYTVVKKRGGETEYPVLGHADHTDNVRENRPERLTTFQSGMPGKES